LINADAGIDLAPRRLKVLFAGDEVLLRRMLCDVLRESGFQVFEAADTAEAIAILRTTPVDVLITDLHMRVVRDGMEFARHVRAHCPGVSLLLASANEPPTRGLQGNIHRSMRSLSSRISPKTS
jgi:CheY-like chemotaxis protein